MQAFTLYSISVFAYTFGFNTTTSQRRKWPYRLISSISDILAVVAIVYIINFLNTGKCNMSVYHYYVALDSVLLVCSTLVLTFAASQQRQKQKELALYLQLQNERQLNPYLQSHGHQHAGRRPIPKNKMTLTAASIIRFIATTIIFTLMGILLVYQISTHAYTPFPHFMPPDIAATNDSAILLPVSCFFDPDLILKRNPYSLQLKPQLTAKRLERIGAPVVNIALPQFWLYVCLACFFAVETLKALMGTCGGRYLVRLRTKRYGATVKPMNERSTWSRYARCAWRILIFGVCLGTDVFCVWHIASLRMWVRASGWLGTDRSEDEIISVGQLMPVCALAGVVLMLSEKCKICGRKERKGRTLGGLRKGRDGKQQLSSV